jgi:gas vesicle protein
MKLSRLLVFAAIGVAAGLLLTQTEKGATLRKDMADAADKWAKKLKKLSKQTGTDLTDLLDEGTETASRAKRRVSNGVA